MARLNVGVLGLSHDHVWGNLAALSAGHHGRLVAAADPDAGLRDRLRALHGAVATHDTFDAVLERRDLDAVLVFSDNRTSAELGVRALGRRLPVMLEKPMAADLAGARALLAAARTAGVPLMVNWPTAWRPALRHGLTLALEGAVGAPVQLSHRGGHAGPREFGCSPQFCDWLYDPRRNGGGALVDYCGYGAVLCRLVLGRPQAVTAVRPAPRKAGLVAEDTAVVVLSYPGALGLLGASRTQVGGAEVDHQPGDVDQRGDERRRGAGGIEPEAAQDKRQHRPRQRAERHDADQREADGERHQDPVRAIVVETEELPRDDARDADGAEDHAERDARRELAHGDPPPVAHPHLAQRKRADDERGRLRSGVAAGAHDERDEERQHDGAAQLAVEVLHGRRREHLAYEQRAQPAAALADHGPEAASRVRLVELLHAAELVDVLRLLLDQRVDDVVHGDDAEQVAAFVDVRHRQEVVLGDGPRRLLAIRPHRPGVL